MFTPFDHEDTNLDEAIASVYEDLKKFSVDDDGYQTAINQLSKLYKLRNDLATLNLQAQKDHAAHQLACDQNTWQEEQDERPFLERLDPNTVLTVTGSLITALIVIKYEQTGVISSKVMSFVRKF